MQAFTVTGAGVTVSATASNVQGTITMPARSNAIHIVNTSATLYVTAKFGIGAQTATLGAAGITLPPMGQVLIEANDTITHIAAIGSGAGPTAVVFTPAYVSV